MNEKKELYRGKAVAVKNEKQTLKALLKAVIFCFIVFALSKYLPFSWFFEIGALFLSALYINKVMKQGTFVATYILYEDTLVVLTRYGFIDIETARYNLSNTHFTQTAIISNGKRVPFYPDEKLKKLILK
ncbi:MAG: hypothetical protein IJZ81_03160 [Clostridia bacterium]|nr:hypothetical protein [Clostridia bacterium]